MTTAQSISGALGWIALTFGEAWLGSRFLPDEWYKNLNKPGWKSPELDFCSRLECSYGCRSVAGMETIRVDGRFLSIRAFVIQLLLNAAWTWTFFSLHRPDVALADISLLWITTLTMLILFWRLVPVAGNFLLSYLA